MLTLLSTIFKPFTTPTATGVATRDITVMVGAAMTMLSVFGILSDDQIAAIKEATSPEMLGALGILMAGGTSAYRLLTKARSVKADEAAKAIDATVPKGAPVRIETPAGTPDIIVPDRSGR
jgi:hypothetical protein